MTRKDTILVAVVINAGLLAILFATAMIYDDTDKDMEVELAMIAPASKSSSLNVPSSLIATANLGDEIDNALKQYNQSSAHPVLAESQPSSVLIPESVPVQAYQADEEDFIPNNSESINYVNITVKKGDSLEKIARANRTTITTIKKDNQLTNEKLTVGQVLKVGIKKELHSPFHAPIAQVESHKPIIEKKETELSVPVYYTIKNGDNPWKIAKQFGVKYDDILKLNQLDEEKARNLKIGDKIRVK